MTNATQARTGKNGSYQIPTGVVLVVPVLILALGLSWVPESPRYLLSRGRTQEAKRALVNSLEEEELELEWTEMGRGMEEQKKIAGTIGPLDIFKGDPLPRI
jgi:hypothetical protein